jgi:microcystin degradation protein MlrC
MKIGVAGITQESNSFAPFPSSLKDFSIESGNHQIHALNRGMNTEVGGFLDELDALGIEAVPLFSAWAVSSGPIEDSDFEALAASLVQEIRNFQFDGLLVALHGAWLSSSHSSADAEMMKRIRQVIGSKLPVVITLDSHANVTPPLLEQIQGLVGYRTYPHVDMAETGRKAARLLYRIITEQLRPRLYWLPIPLLAPPQSATTDQAPIKDILFRLDQELPRDVTLSSSLFYVQPWLDIKQVKSGLVAVARSESEEIPAVLRDIASELWERRGELNVDWTSPADLMSEVRQEKNRPVIVSEAFDSPSGGAPGDNPGLLSMLLPLQKELSACVFIVDPGVAQHSFEIGIRGAFKGNLGAHSDKRFGPPVWVDARVAHLSDGEFVFKGPVFMGRKVTMGPTAVLETSCLKIVVGSRPVFVIDPELYRSQGIEPSLQDVAAVKSPVLFRPGYASMLRRVLHLDMPGVCPGNLPKAPFKDINRPVWPLDNFSWKGQEQAVLCF